MDGVYVTPNLPIDASTWLNFMPHLGDHRFVVLDIKSKALVGDDLLKIVQKNRRHDGYPVTFQRQFWNINLAWQHI
jgi:hypothetical protein